MSKRIRIALIDDHPLVREGTAAVLNAVGDLEVVATGQDATDAAAVLARDDIDVVVLDIRLGEASGLSSLVGRVRERPAVLILTAYDIPQYAAAALRMGASGFVVKTAPTEQLIEAIRNVAAGGLSFSVRPPGRVLLSVREREVVLLVIDGRSNDEIASSLGIAAKTVETHLRRLFIRFDLASRTELATRAIREGWIDLPVAPPGR